MDKTFNIADLITKSIKGELTDQERNQLQQWLTQDARNQALFERLSHKHLLVEKVDHYQKFNKNRVWEALEEEITPTRSLSYWNARTLRYAASILLPVILSAGIIYFFASRSAVDQMATIDEVIVPGSNKATLTLADGSTVELEGDQALTQLSQGSATVSNNQSELSYHTDNQLENTELIYNQLNTPNGGRYQVRLSDGTRVVLNAGSSLRYPTTFGDSTRTVFLSGEAYFEVTTTGVPFIVSHVAQDIRVLGTVFNVTGYTDDAEVTTTLAEGSVRIETTGNSQILRPGEQSILQKAADTIEVSEVNTNLYTAWVDGKFEFSNDSMEEVVKRLARWYDFTYTFENPDVANYHFTGRIDDGQTISSILEMLEATSAITFELNGNTIVIK